MNKKQEIDEETKSEIILDFLVHIRKHGTTPTVKNELHSAVIWGTMEEILDEYALSVLPEKRDENTVAMQSIGKDGKITERSARLIYGHKAWNSCIDQTKQNIKGEL